MVERVCENALKRLCRQVVERHNPPIVRLKGDTEDIPTNPFKNFVDGEFGWFNTYLVGMSKPRAMCHDKCVAFFDKNAEIINRIFIKEKYYDDVEYAMFKTKDFMVLFQQFLIWFGDKRRKFQMEFNASEAKKTDARKW